MISLHVGGLEINSAKSPCFLWLSSLKLQPLKYVPVIRVRALLSRVVFGAAISSIIAAVVK